MADVTELITRFSFEGSSSPLNDYNLALGDGIGLLIGFGAAVAGSAALIGTFASNTLEAIQPLIDLSAATGVAVERIQELNFIASVSNSSIEQVASSLEGLSTKIGEAGQKGSEEFSRLGISVRNSNGIMKSTDTVLTEIGNRFQTLGLSLNEQKSISEALGIDASLLTMLNRSSAEMGKLANRARELGILNQEQIEQAQEYNDSLTTLRFGMDGLRRLIAVGLAPQMSSLVDSFTDILIANKDWIIGGITATFELLSDLTDALVRVFPLLATGVGIFVALKVATLGWATALGLIFSPAIIAAGIISAIIFVVDDLIVAFNGGQSAIRDLFLEFFNFDIVPSLNFIVDGITGAFDSILNAGKALINDLINIFSNLDNIVPNWLLDMFNDKAKIEINGVSMPVASTFSAEDLPDNSMLPSGSVSNSNSRVEQNVNIDIRSTDPERAGVVIRDTLQEQMTDAQYQSRRGGM